MSFKNSYTEDVITTGQYENYLKIKKETTDFEGRMENFLASLKFIADDENISFFYNNISINPRILSFSITLDIFDHSKRPETVYLNMEEILNKTPKQYYPEFKKLVDLDQASKKHQEDRNFAYYLQLKAHYAKEGKA